MSQLASVDPIGDLATWSAKGAAGDALQRVEHESPIVCIWLDKDKDFKWSKANTDFASLSMFAAILLEFAQSCAREKLK